MRVAKCELLYACIPHVCLDVCILTLASLLKRLYLLYVRSQRGVDSVLKFYELKLFWLQREDVTIAWNFNAFLHGS